MANAPVTRARDADQKLARKHSLMDAGWQLFMELGHMPSVSQVVQKAGLAKGTFYIYFNTKEELFLELMSDALSEFFEVLTQAFLLPQIDIEKYIDLFVSRFDKDHKLIKLGTLMAGVLEQNSEEDTIKKFKLDLVKRLELAGSIVRARFPQVSEPLAARLILRSYAAMQGIAQMIPASPAHAKWMEDPAFAYIALDFAAESKATLKALWSGTLLELGFPLQT